MRGIMLPSLHRLSLGARDETPTEGLVNWRAARQHGAVTRGNKRLCQEQYLKGTCPITLEDFGDGEDVWELEMVEGKPLYKPEDLYHALIASWEQTRQFRDPKSRQPVPRTEVVKLHTHLVDRNVLNLPDVPPEPVPPVVPVVPVDNTREYERLIAEIAALLPDTVRTPSAIQDARTKMHQLKDLMHTDYGRPLHTNQGLLVQVTQMIVNGLRNPSPMIVAKAAYLTQWVVETAEHEPWHGSPDEATTYYRPLFDTVFGALISVFVRFQPPENALPYEEMDMLMRDVGGAVLDFKMMLDQETGIDGSWLPDALRASEFASIAREALWRWSRWTDRSRSARPDLFMVHVLKMVYDITNLLRGPYPLFEEPDRAVWLNRLAEDFLVAPVPGPVRLPTHFFEHLMRMITNVAQVPPRQMIRLADEFHGDCILLTIAGNLAWRACLIESAKSFYSDLVNGLTRAMDKINRTDPVDREHFNKLLRLFRDAVNAVVTAVSNPRSIRADLFFHFSAHEQLGRVLHAFLTRKFDSLARQVAFDLDYDTDIRADTIQALVHGIAFVWDLCRNRTDRLVGPFVLSRSLKRTLRAARDFVRESGTYNSMEDTEKRLLEFVSNNY